MIELTNKIKGFDKLSIDAKVTIAFLFCSILQKTMSIITTPIFTRIMTTTEYGEFSIYQSWLLILSIITTFRLDYDVFNKGMAKYPDRNNEYTSAMQVTTSFLTFICLIIYLVFRTQINAITGLSTFITIAIFLELFFTPAVSFWMLKERFNFRYKKLVIVTLVITFSNLLISIVATVMSENRGAARILSGIFVYIVIGGYFYIYNLKSSRRIFDLSYAKFALGFNMPLIPHYFSMYILAMSDRIMIQKIRGLSEAGIYNVVYSAAFAFTMITTGINNSMIPWQYKNLASKNFKNLNEKLKYMMILIIVVLTTYIAVAPEILAIMAPSEYALGIYVIPPVAASTFFMFIINLLCNVEFYYDKNKFTMIISICCAILNIILNGIFITSYGFIAAGYTTLICYILDMYAHLIYANYVARLKDKMPIYNIRNITLCSSLLLIISIGLSFTYNIAFIRYLIVILGIIFVFVKRNEIIKIIKND